MEERKKQDDFFRQLERLDDQRRIDLLRELQDATVRLGEIQAKIQGIEMKVQRNRVARIQLGHDTAMPLAISIHRIGENGWQGFVAEEDTQLQPGDVIEVVLPLPHTAFSTGAVQSPSPQSPSGTSIMGAIAREDAEVNEQKLPSSVSPNSADAHGNHPITELISMQPSETSGESDVKTVRSATNSLDTTGLNRARPAAPSASIPVVPPAPETAELATQSGSASMRIPALVLKTLKIMAGEKPIDTVHKVPPLAGPLPETRHHRPLPLVLPLGLLP
jgi:hypothetical protein